MRRSTTPMDGIRRIVAIAMLMQQLPPRSVRRLLCSLALVLLAAPVSAQIVLPEQRISRFVAMPGEPRLAAIGSRVFGVWLGAEEGLGYTNVGYGYSLNSGQDWVNAIGIPESGSTACCSVVRSTTA